MKDYIERDGKTFRVEVIYTKGGMNYFSGGVNKRGYYLSVRPVELERRAGGIVVESFEIFGGTSYFLKEVKRQSDKAMKEAVELAAPKVDELINYLLIRVKQAHKS